MDGALIFIADETILFKVQLADYLLPGPLVYAKDTESLLLANSNLEIEAYTL